MKSSIALIAAVGIASVAQFATAGDITGTVTLSGTAPAEREITPLENDPTCGKLHTEKVFTGFYQTGAGKGLADVVVMLKGDNVKPKPADASTPAVVIDQKGCLYLPQFVTIQTGQTLTVKNSEGPGIVHNVHINPTAPSTLDTYTSAGKITQIQSPGGADLTFNFAAPENFMKVNCDVHPWMFAWVTVVDNPYFAQTDKDGKFTIKNVPPGKYTISALHYKLAKEGVDKQVEVKDGGATVDFTLEVK